MAGISEKLYPPTINGTLPAFYDENGTATIAVPFSMSRAVNQNDIGGFKLKIKTVQSNTEIITLTNSNPAISIAEGKVIFEWPGFQNYRNTLESKKIKLGQYLKVQLAYYSITGVVGYFSTVGIIKYTAKPNVYIEGLNVSHGSSNRSTYVGVFEAGEDKSERPYYYNFSLFDKLGQLVETTGWLIHNTTINNVSSESLSLDRTTDSYDFNAALNVNEEYWVQYSVRTINNLEVSSPLYNIAEVDTGASLLEVGLRAKNNFDDGYISLYFYSEDEQRINSSTVLTEPVSIEILRSEKTDNFSSWRTITQIYISSYQYAFESDSCKIKDFTVEQGITYKYCFREFNAAGIQSNRTFSNEVFCDFEDMFLYDGERQLKIRFNPKVSSLKITRLETKSDTIGNRYPFIFRNGVVGYKEFPISGLISYLMDDNNLFLNKKDDLNILSGTDSERIGSPVDQDSDDVILGKSWELSQTVNSLGYNIRAERRFKLKVLEWLGDGKIKLFRSPTEGNYLVRLMNISLSPEDKLGRMIHTFSSTAYEVEEYNYNNLYNLGFFKTPNIIESNYEYKTIKLCDVIPNDGGSFKINQDDIIGYARLELSPSGEGGTPFRVRVGSNDILVIAPGYFLGTEGSGYNIHYPDFYYDPSLNDNITSKNAIKTLVQDASLTYMYENKKLAVGTFKNITNAYLTTIIKTFNGNNGEFNFGLQNTSTLQQEIIKFYSIKFKQKESKTIYKYLDNGQIVYKDSSNNILANDQFDELLVYEIVDRTSDLANVTAEKFYWNNYEFVEFDNGEPNTSIILYFEDAEDEEFDQDVILDLTDHINEIEHPLLGMWLGNGIFVECAYQVKVIEKEG